MKTLDKNWITEKVIDFEYKKYILLSYLQEVSLNFNEQKLYPFFSDLIYHYRNLLEIKENKNFLFEKFPERIVNLDLEQYKIQFEKIMSDDTIMQEIEQIIDYSIPKFEQHLADGKKIFDYIEDHLSISPVGIISLNPSEGYLFLKNGSEHETRVYEYQITIFENPNDKMRGIHVNYLKSFEKSIANTAEHIKKEMIKYHKKLPNPATYVVETDLELPFSETLLPIAKRLFVKYVATTG